MFAVTSSRLCVKERKKARRRKTKRKNENKERKKGEKIENRKSRF